MKRKAGFTSLELLIVLTIFGVCLAAGYPSLRKWIENQRVIGAAQELTSAFWLARSRAVTEKRMVDVYLDTRNGTHASYWVFPDWHVAGPRLIHQSKPHANVWMETDLEKVRFYEDGSASPPGSILFTNHVSTHRQVTIRRIGTASMFIPETERR